MLIYPLLSLSSVKKTHLHVLPSTVTCMVVREGWSTVATTRHLWSASWGPTTTMALALPSLWANTSRRKAPSFANASGCDSSFCTCRIQLTACDYRDAAGGGKRAAERQLALVQYKGQLFVSLFWCALVRPKILSTCSPTSWAGRESLLVMASRLEYGSICNSITTDVKHHAHVHLYTPVWTDPSKIVCIHERQCMLVQTW